MFTRILVSLDGSVLTETIMNPARGDSFAEPSMASSLVDRLEAEIQIDQNAITNGVQCEGIHPFSLNYEDSNAEAILAVADAMEVDTIVTAPPTAVPAYSAG